MDDGRGHRGRGCRACSGLQNPIAASPAPADGPGPSSRAVASLSYPTDLLALSCTHWPWVFPAQEPRNLLERCAAAWVACPLQEADLRPLPQGAIQSLPRVATTGTLSRPRGARVQLRSSVFQVRIGAPLPPHTACPDSDGDRDPWYTVNRPSAVDGDSTTASRWTEHVLSLPGSQGLRCGMPEPPPPPNPNEALLDVSRRPHVITR